MEKEIQFDRVHFENTKSLIGLVSKGTASDRVIAKARQILLARLGPWKMAAKGVIRPNERDELIERRLVLLSEGIDLLIERFANSVSALIVLLIGVALGAFLHEALFIVPILMIGAIITGGQPSLLSPPILLPVWLLRRAAMQRGIDLALLGEPHFRFESDADEVEQDFASHPLANLTDPELRQVARDRGVMHADDMSREDLIAMLAVEE